MKSYFTSGMHSVEKKTPTKLAGLVFALQYILLCSLFFPCLSAADPLQDQLQLRQYYRQRFPQLEVKNFAEGVYALDPVARESWQAIEEFPPYEPAIDQGETAFNTPFNNGHTYAECFPNKGIGIANQYPRWNDRKNEVITLAKAINDCRISNGETALPYKKGPITHLLAYMVYTSRDKPIDIKIPDNDQALAAYEQGREYYYQRRGQLNFSCATCHIQNAGNKIRAETLSPMIGHTSGWPTYRLKWGEMGTLHRRFIGCHKQIRATALPAQSPAYRNLEYFMSFISNGIPVNGPSTRK